MYDLYISGFLALEYIRVDLKLAYLKGTKHLHVL